MTTIPPAPPPVSAPSAPPPAVVTATPVSDVPAEIASLPVNTVIDATVAAAVAQARAVVQLVTSLGTVSVRLPLPVQPNTELKLLVVGTGTNLQLRVIAINGQALQPGLVPTLGEIPPQNYPPLAGPLGGGPLAGPITATGTTAQTQSGASGAGAAASGETFPTVPANVGIGATVVFGTQPGLPTGTQLILRLLNVQPPLPGAPGSVTAPTGPLVGTAPPTGPSGPTVPGALPLDPKTGLPIVIATGQPEPGLPPTAAGHTPAVPGTTSPNAGMLTPGTTPEDPTLQSGPGSNPATSFDPTVPLHGTVAPNSLGGKPLIQTSVGLISLDATPDLQAGARVSFETVGNPIPPAASTAQSGSLAPAPGQPATGWTAFGDAMAVLQKADPAAAQSLVQRLPDLGPQFTANAVTWIAAAQTGDLRAWIGDRAVKALEKVGRVDLINRLESDMGAMRATVTLPRGAGDWQALTLPLFFGQQIERIRLTLRRAHDEDEAEGHDEEGLRFLVDVDMSRLGPLQFDGLVKRNAKRFDLIVRSRRALSDEVQRDIGTIFIRALENMGMAGGAVFKQAAAFVEPIPDPAGRHAGLTA